MSARKTTTAAGVAIDDNTEIVGEEGSEITVKCVSGKGSVLGIREAVLIECATEDILASKTNVKANCYCNVLSGVEKLRRTLSESELEALGKTPFGHLLDVGNLKWVNGQLLILLALNYVEPIEPDSDAISFHIRDRVVSFKKTDFALITGFKFGCPAEQEREYTGTSDISSRYFGGRSVVTRDEVRVVLEGLKDNKRKREMDGVKIGVLYLLGSHIVGNQPSMKLPPLYLHLVDDLSRLNAYPWGDEIWDLLVEDMAKCSLTLRTSKKDRFTFPGFLMALQIWAFETFPGLEKREVCEMIESRRGKWPRALRWAAPTLTNHIVLEEVIFSNAKFEWIGMKATALEIGKENVKCLFLNTPMIEGDGSLKGTKHVGKKRKPNIRNPSQGKKGKKRTCGKKGDDKARKGVNEELLEKVTKLEEMVTGLVATNVLDRKLLVSLRGKVKGMQRAHERHAVLMERCLKKCGLIRRRKKGIKKSRQHAEDGPSFDLGIEHGGNEGSAADQEEGSEDNVNLGASDYEMENPTQLNDLDDTINSVDTQILLERRAVMVENHVEKIASEDMRSGDSNVPIAILAEKEGVSIQVLDNGGSLQGNAVGMSVGRNEVTPTQLSEEHNPRGHGDAYDRPKRKLKSPERFTFSDKKAGDQRKRAKRRADVIESKSVCDELCLGPFTKEPMDLPEVGVLERVDTFMHKGLLKKPKNPGRRYTATDEKLSADAIMELDDEEDTLSKTWYYNLYFPDGCLSNLKATDFGLEQKFATTSPAFVELLCVLYERVLKREITDSDAAQNSDILNTIKGNNMEYGRAWSEADFVYMPLNTGSEWVLLVVDVRGKLIRVYDTNVYRGGFLKKLHPFLPSLQMFLPVLMGKLAVYKDSTDSKESHTAFPVEPVLECPQKNDGPSSGIFVMKMAELLMMGRGVIEIEPGQINTYRKKITADILMHNNTRNTDGAGCVGMDIEFNNEENMIMRLVIDPAGENVARIILPETVVDVAIEAYPRM
ncbi:unnamed protein product [Cuscuta campestris]|uniref:Ubiquitin-like protease family profile domain-containing protein n=1 Tax=Cuscuta campestris TaxID=132261 RepID=A0A484MI28_9ASTE|nr:unnamed protein product [Cuscuta campestris]